MLTHRLLHGFLRRFFKLLYNEWAWAYDAVAHFVSLGKWRSWTFSGLPYLKGPRVLELGTGTGYLLAAMRLRGLSAVGLDASWCMARLAGRGFGLVVNGYAQFLPFPSCSFDQIISTFPSDFLWQPETLTEVWRVLVPGGELIILPAAWITGRRPAERLAARLFHLTGQSPPSLDLETALTEPLLQAGFQVRVKLTQLNSSLVLLVFARKVGSLVK